MMRTIDRVSGYHGREITELAERVRALERPLANSDDLDPLMERIGTRAMFSWRGLSRHLGVLHLADADQPAADREKGFSFIAVEGDWPDCYRVNQYVRGLARPAATPARCCTHSTAGRPGCGRTRRSSSWPSGSGGTTTACRRSARSASTGWTSTACGARCRRCIGYLHRTDPAAVRAARRHSGASSRTARTCRSMRGRRGSCRPRARTRWSPC